MRYLTLLFTVCLVGCAAQKPITVDIPVVAQGTPIAIPDKPHLPIKDLTKKSTDAQIFKAYVATVRLLDKWGTDCYQIAKTCQ